MVGSAIMALKLPENFGQVDVLSAITRRDLRIGFSRFGTRPRNYFLGRSVPWKGLRKGANESFEEYLKRLQKVNARVAVGLQNAVTMSVGNKGSRGVVLCEINGVRKVMPRFAYELALKGKGVKQADGTYVKKSVTHIADYASAQAVPPSALMA